MERWMPIATNMHDFQNTFGLLCIHLCTWWRHQMETFSALLAICAGNSAVTGEFPAQRKVKRSCGVFFDLRLNKRLSKQWWGWWFETPSRPSWRHCNGFTCILGDTSDACGVVGELYFDDHGPTGQFSQSKNWLLSGRHPRLQVVPCALSWWVYDDVINSKHFPCYWSFVGEFIGYRWIPRTKPSDAELWCFPWSAHD